MSRTYRFGNAELLTVERQLLVEGRAATLGSRAFDVLIALIERRDRVVTKHELLDVAWPGLVVEENNLAAQVSALRKTLGAHVLATIPGIGYRFCVPVAGDEPPPPPGSTRVEPRLTNLPTPTEILIGRDSELATVGEMLDEHRLVTITGPAGIGKTRLAQELARARAGRFPAGVWWVDLAAIPAKELVVPAIAHAAQLEIGGGDPEEGLTRAVGDRRMLLVLDNCEYVAQHASHVVRSLLAGAPGVRVLVTSQEQLRVPGEFTYVLDGLEIASVEASPEAARACAALRLLELRARAVDARYRLADAKVPLAIELCRRLDGMALAIEMAAARIPLMGIETLLSRLGERLQLLRSADRSAAARYRTMRATVEWSYSLLSTPQQAVFRRLSAFAGSFRLDVALRAASGGDLDEWEVLDGLSALVDKSLVRLDGADPPRYRLLETLRLFGMELLSEKGELESAVHGHAAAMSALAEEILQAFDVETEGACVRRHAPDYDDLLAVWNRGRERGDPDLASRTVMAAATLDIARGIYQPRWLDKSAAHALALRAEPLARARLWYCIALKKYTSGVSNVDAAQAHVAAWREVRDDRRVFEALGDLAEFLAAADRGDEAEDALAEMRGLIQPTWPAQMRLSYHWPATVTAAFGGDMALLAARLDDQERAAAAAGSFRRAVVYSWQRVAWAVGAGNLPHALELGQIAIRKAEQFGNPSAIAAARLSHASALMLSGDLAGVPFAAARVAGRFTTRGIHGKRLGRFRTLRRQDQPGGTLGAPVGSCGRLLRPNRPAPRPAGVTRRVGSARGCEDRTRSAGVRAPAHNRSWRAAIRRANARGGARDRILGRAQGSRLIGSPEAIRGCGVTCRR